MIFTHIIAELKRLDEIETKVYLENPNPPMSFTNDDTKFLEKIKETQIHFVRIMANTLGFKMIEALNG